MRIDIRHIIVLLLIFTFSGSLIAQEVYEVTPVASLNNDLDQWPVEVIGDELVYFSTTGDPLISDWKNANKNVDLFHSKHEMNWYIFNIQNEFVMESLTRGKIQGITKAKSSEDYVISIADDRKSTNALYLTQDLEGKKSDVNRMAFCEEGINYIHPSFSKDGNQLYFSSDDPSGKGGYDIYMSVKKPDGTWGHPIALGGTVNSPTDDLYPRISENGLYFSTERNEGKGGLDIYFAAFNDQWQKIKCLDGPINTPFDDFAYMEINEDKGFMASNRNQGKGSDIFFYNVENDKNKTHGMTARLECKGTPIQNAEVRIYNNTDERVFTGNTGKDGSFSLGQLPLKRNYKVKFVGLSADVMKSSALYILDEFGTTVMILRPNARGEFIFELLHPDDISQLELDDNSDLSELLTIDIEGQVFEEEPGDIGSGTPIYMIDDNGDLMALAYTSDEGRFKFSELGPKAKYTIKTDEDSEASKIIIMDKGEEIVIPLNDNTAQFQRVSDEEAISLINEKGAPILIRKDEVFVIQNIYYALNSAALNETAKYQLEQLIDILSTNPQIEIELGSHTDCRGEDEYNLSLSDRRARTAVEYLVSKGIDEGRMTAHGYGETKLLNECDDGVECTEDEHSENRRTEIQIFVK